MKSGDGGGLEEEGEMIDVVEMSVEEARSFLRKQTLNSSPLTLYGLYWFLANRAAA